MTACYLSKDKQIELAQIAQSLATSGKGILAVDEPADVIESRFSPVNIENNEETRRYYRQLLFRTKKSSQYISDIILCHETFHHKTDDDNTPFPRLLKDNGIITGITVDKGLEEQCREYKKLGAQFAKWRAVIKISHHAPSQLAINENASTLARYASICQQCGLVPIVEPEVLQDGDHDLEECQRITEKVLATVYKALNDHHVYLEGTLLKPSMVTPGGHNEQYPTIYLNAINRIALVLSAWEGDKANDEQALRELIRLAKQNSLASLGKYEAAMLTIMFRHNSSSSMKYILVTGGVISGIGKGIISSSIGTILRSHGFRVTSIKIDPYINIDAGTFSPYEHGEVFVLDDGGEVDLDLGNYERFLDVTLHRDNNITTGKIYQYVIDKERRGDYLGKTVQVVPHITDAIQEWVERVARISVDEDQAEPDICIIELGGTIGDIESMSFVEAFRQFQFRVKKENFCLVHVSLVPQPNSTNEHKTKPTQHSVKELRGYGLTPDLIICRSATPMPLSAKEKVSMFCQVDKEHVICIPDVKTLFRVPLLMEENGVFNFLSTRLHLMPKSNYDRSLMIKWRDLAER
ncbi:unnamed protein product [Rotaria sp. Silwood2]|nr:unnamed protein product [Rotaria sp. Silwood2]